MTNPTSNFGWQMPTPTDLVTDLPADFEVFGQAVDTEFADLLGGTTGQILSKASNTDMDFTWITNDVGDITAVNVTSPITGGGSSGAVTIGVSAASTSASGVVQLSDSTSTTSSVLASTPTATKSAYDLAASAYAPAFTNNFYAGKNKLINGNFAINQRAFTSVTTTGTYGFDRWLQGYVDGTVTYTPQTFTPGAAPVAGYEGSTYAQLAVTGQTLTTAQSQINQRIESVRTLAGQTATMSFWAKANTGTPNVLVNIAQVFGTGGSPSATVQVQAAAQAITTSWARYSFTVAIPSISGKTLGTTAGTDYLAAQIYVSGGSASTAPTLGIQNNTFQIWGVQLEAGSTATPFQTASGSIGGELALCQRYYQRSTAGTVYANYGTGSANSTTNCIITVPLIVSMRTVPASVDYSTLAVGDGTGVNAVSAVSISQTTTQTVQLEAASTSLTSLRFYRLIANNSTSSYLGFSAEL